MIGNGPLGAAHSTPVGRRSPVRLPQRSARSCRCTTNTVPAKSQLESALEGRSIATTACAGKPVTTITLNIGANDELHDRQTLRSRSTRQKQRLGKGELARRRPKEASENVREAASSPAPRLFAHILDEHRHDPDGARANGSQFGGVNYAGQIIVQGGYDPYGNVCFRSERANVLRRRLERLQPAR